MITVDPALPDDAVEHANIMLPRRVLRWLNTRAWAAGESRSGYIASLAIG